MASALPASAAKGDAEWSLALQAPQVGGAPSGADEKSSSKLSPAIQSALTPAPATLESFTPNAVGGGASPAAAWFAAGLLRETSPGLLQVYIHVDGEIDDGLRAALEAAGAAIEMESVDEGIVQASVPYGALEALADVAGVVRLSEPSYGVVNVGANLAEGDALMNLDDLRSIQGVDGTGVTVGVISDGIAGLQTAVASGDLPATGETRSAGVLTATSGGVIAQSFRASDNDLEGGLGSAPGAEGTAILEIVHDIAPGAQLRFANFSTSLEFNAAVNFLASVSDVVIDDIGWLARPTDGSSDVSTNTANALTNVGFPIRAYATSVGNQALRHYQGSYVDSGLDGTAFVGFAGNFHTFAATGGTTDCTALGPRAANLILLAPGQTTSIFLTWNETFGSATSDYDLFLREYPSGPVVAQSISDNVNITHDPVEAIVYTNPNGSNTFYDVFVQNSGNAAPPRILEMYFGAAITCGGAAANYNTIAGSVPAQSDAGGGVLSVGAINASDPGSDSIASYSSHGPTGDGRIKPDITAIDGVDVSGAGGFPDPFFGTSAAAPHIAGLAALLLEYRPDLRSGEAGDDPAVDRATLRNAILNGAVDLGAAGVDNVFGYGRADGLGSATQLFAAPVLDAHGPVTSVEGSVLSLTDLSFSDPNATGVFGVTIDWGDAQVSTASVDQVLRVASATHAYDDDGAYVINATVTDDGGATDAVQFTATIANAAPVVTAATGVTGNDLFATTMTLATFTDAGAADTHTAVIDWGDGTVEAGTVAAGSVSGTHLLLTVGVNQITVTVTDDDGASASTVVDIGVFNPPPVPGMSTWGMALGTVLLALAMIWASRRRPATMAPRT
jgi:hypothetical protein